MPSNTSSKVTKKSGRTRAVFGNWTGHKRCQKIVGHKTEAIYRRCAIAEEKCSGEAADTLEILQAMDQQKTSSKVSRENGIQPRA